MGWKEDLEAEIAAERETLQKAGVEQVTPPEQTEAQADAYLRDEPGDLETVGRSEEVTAEGRTLQEAGVTYEGEADLNEVIQTVEDEGAPEVPEAAATEYEEMSWETASPETHAEYQAYLDETNADIPLQEQPEVTEPEAETPEVSEPEEAQAEVTEPEAEAPEVAESETDDFEAWADSKAPAAPEQGQEIEQDTPEPEQTEMSFDEER